MPQAHFQLLPEPTKESVLEKHAELTAKELTGIEAIDSGHEAVERRVMELLQEVTA
jgi:hypothetical protein